MSSLGDRAVAVVVDQGRVLVMRRHRHGRDYSVVPGGSVESGESPREATLRELREETGLDGRVERHLWTLENADRVSHYFLVRVAPAPMAVGGPELPRQSTDNRYTPQWVGLDELEAVNLQPVALRRLLLALRDQG